ncbi:MAG: hypothetical protein ACRDRH_18925 [Pseudonocardia sp.]
MSRSQDRDTGCAVAAADDAATTDEGRTNVALAALLARAGWTPENLGDRLNRLSHEQGLGLRGHRRSVRRWVYAEPGRDAPRVPREPWPSLVCHVLHERLGEPVTVQMLGWPAQPGMLYVPADHGLDMAWSSVGAVEALAAVVDAGAVDRRHFLTLTGMTLTSAAHEWLFDPARVAASVQGKRVGHELVDDLEQLAATKRHMDDALGGGTLLPSVREDLRLVTAMLRNASFTDDVGRRLFSMAAEMGRLAGWLAYDSDRNALAQRFWLASLRAAHASGDRAMGANVLGFMSVQAALSERPRDAVLLAESALSQEKELSPAVAALLYSRLAFASARAGDERGWLRSQSQAERLLTRSSPGSEPAWVYWFTEAELEGVAGTALLEFDRAGEASRLIAMRQPRRCASSIPGSAASWRRSRAAASRRRSHGTEEEACPACVS